MDDASDVRLQPGPHVFVEQLEAPELAPQDRHHLSKALRLRAGDALTLSDGNGRWRTGVFGSVVEATGPIVTIGDPVYPVALGVALAKAGKPEFIVQKATELGINRIVLFPAEHSVVRWDEAKRRKNNERLGRVAREAAMQSRQVHIPQVEVASNLMAAVAGLPVARADFVGTSTISDHRFVVIGPEGGWSDHERELIPEAVELGPTVLRAETAAVVAATLLVGPRNSLP